MATQSGQDVIGQKDPGSSRQGEERAPHVTSARTLPLRRGLVHCKFFATRTGCRAGDTCPYIHDTSKLQDHGPRPKAKRKPVHEQGASGPSQDTDTGTGTSTETKPAINSTEGRRFIAPPVDAGRVVRKPVPKAQAEDQREFQIKQLKRRFSPTETVEDGGTVFAFQMLPSDPDFPFEMVGLDCVLHVPLTYPKGSKPSLGVTNTEMGREWQMRVERGFARLAERTPQGTLLALMNSLDRQLEDLLTDRKEDEGVTIIPNRLPGKVEPVDFIQEATKRSTPISAIPSKPQATFTPEQYRSAAQRRELETRQLEARLGRTPLFSKSSDGIGYTIPITPRKIADLPVPLQSLNVVKLIVPMIYPLQHCRIELQNVSREAAKTTEKGFEKKMQESVEASLMGHINWLAQNMHVLATEVIDESVVETEVIVAQDLSPVQAGKSAIEKKTDPAFNGEDDDRSHIKIIPPPPEWVMVNEDDGECSGDSEYSDSYDSGDEDEDAEGGAAACETVPGSAPSSGPERGISLSFPSLELHGIELLELASLCITIKCERCKDTMDLSNLRDKVTKSESCKKCAVPLSVGYRRELMHVNSFRAGYLDLEGCTAVDMLPSNFLPTCSECSSTHPSPGVVSVRGESSMAVCRECHRKMTFKIPEVKFLLVSSAARAGRAPVRKKPKESLGIIAGHELPRRGRCAHYSKSYRWFRFSCCSKVFPCDKCHDAATDHPNEHANRMICGFCSREQNYRPEECGVCREGLVKKAGSGFWEGGKGTRDKGRMSRKDPRKYKRRGGGAVRKVKG